jgi:hypothetical protein
MHSSRGAIHRCRNDRAPHSSLKWHLALYLSRKHSGRDPMFFATEMTMNDQSDATLCGDQRLSKHLKRLESESIEISSRSHCCGYM